MVLTKSLAVALWVLVGTAVFLPCDANGGGHSVLKRPATRGQRKKGWRRRAQDWESASSSTPSTRQGSTSTIVTNPSSLGKGKGKGGDGTVTFTEDDENGRTTFVINCRDNKAMSVEKVSEKASEKAMGPSSTGKGKGKGLGGDKGVAETKLGGDKGVSESSVKASTKTIPDDICDDVSSDDEFGTGGGGGWTDDDDVNGGGGSGGDGTGGGSGSGTGGGSGSGTGTGLGTDDDFNYPPDSGQIVSGGVGAGGLSSCDSISMGTGPTTGNAIQYDVSLDVIKEADLPSIGIMRLMQADLQFNVAPEIADCVFDDGSMGSGSGGASNITNVEFLELIGDENGCSSYTVEEIAAFEEEGGTCLNTIIPVILYYEGDDTTGFLTRVQDAIDNHEWNVPGLIDTADVERDGGAGITAIAGQESEESRSTIGAAGYLSIAAAAIVFALVAFMLFRRNRREEEVKHVSLEDDDDTYLRDLENESHGSGRLARVVGEDDSVITGFTGARTFDGPMDGYFNGMETRPAHQDVHICSSATCEVCERNRQSGVQFVPSGTTPAQHPPEGPRDYDAKDTVML